jgi:hypothetical protein
VSERFWTVIVFDGTDTPSHAYGRFAKPVDARNAAREIVAHQHVRATVLPLLTGRTPEVVSTR